MAVALDYGKITSLPDGEHDGILQYNDCPVTVIVAGGTVEHLGYSFFTPHAREQLGPVVCNFLERYALECDLPLEREKDVLVQQYEDGISFAEGSLQSLKTFCRDTTASVRIELLGTARYRVSWNGGDLSFPIDHQLLLGRDQLENEARLPSEIAACTQVPHPASVSEDSFYLEQLASRFYYDDRGQYVDSPSRPLETLSNMMAGAVPTGSVTALVKMNVYGLKFEYFEVPLNHIVSYGIRTGCTPYFGVMDVNGDMLECELILRQVEAGYAHALRMWIPADVAGTKEGRMQVRLTPFIPMHSLKYLFEETRQ